MTLKDAAVGRNNNLNIIRLVAALLVLYMHSFAVSVGDESGDIFGIITMGKEHAGGIAVDVFFMISGFLICKSYANKKSLWSYIKARFLRIWPLLFVVVMVLAFGVGPLVTTYTKHDYFAFSTHILYFLRNLVFISAYTGLPGVFMNHYYSSVDGSLWTLLYEVLCYIFVAISAPIWKRKRIAAPIFTLLAMGLYIVETYIFHFSVGPVSQLFITNIGKLYMFFGMGMCYYLFKDRIVLSIKMFLVFLVALVLGTIFFDFSIVFSLFGTYIIFYVAFQKRFVSKRYNKIGDLSYGIYLLSFPVQQLVVSWLGVPTEELFLTMNPYLNMLLSVLIVVPLSLITWKFIEEPCLKLKNIKKSRFKVIK